MTSPEPPAREPPAPAGGMLDRATGALLGLATGDALGMPTQLLTRAQVVARYGALLDGFRPGPPDHPVAGGMPAGAVTDDTEQALLLARLLVEGDGRVEPATWARALRDWEAGMVARGSADLLGPSTRRALAAFALGAPPEEAGRDGETNGAAMRIAPVGIAVPLEEGGSASAEVDRLADAVAAVSRITHGTDVALAGATAVAAAVSVGVAGGDVDAAVAAGIAAAPAGAARGRATAAPDLVPLLVAARALGEAAGPDVTAAEAAHLADLVESRVGTGLATTESVPAAFAVLTGCPDDPWLACLVAASLGGDSDTIAAMVGAVAGACHGAAAFPAGARALVEKVSGLDALHRGDLGVLAVGLLALRARAAGATR